MQEDDGQPGDAARAFEDLRAEVSVLRRAIGQASVQGSTKVLDAA